MTSFNTGAKNSAVTAGSVTLAIPAGVLAGDVMLMALEVFTETGTAPTISFSGAGGNWTLVPMTTGTNPEVATAGSSIWSYCYAYYRVATAGDQGATLTITETGSAAGTTWMSVAMGAYTGASTSSPVDVAFGNNAQGTNTGTAPSGNTAAAGDWAIYLAGVGLTNSTFTGPGTSRENVVSGSNIGAAVDDSNGSVGGSGTSIGGGTWSQGAGTANWWSLFTIGLAPPSAPPKAPVPPDLRMHPLWEEILAAGAYRANVAPAAATPAAFSWRLMDGAAGRPGAGPTGTQPPSTATSNASALVNGTSFYVTQGGMWFQGYWYYCCASGQATTAVQCALWSATSAGGAVVPGSKATSGTLTAGAWNWIPLAQPVQLAIWGIYIAAVGVPAGAGFPDTASQFGAAEPYAAGIVNGPLVAFSDTGGSNPDPYSIGQAPTASGGSNPSVTEPFGDSGTHDNWWLDVQVTNVPPAGYQGSYRLWPNMTDADFTTTADASANYVIGTEIRLSQPSRINAIWYYAAANQGFSGNQWATSADIWNVRTGVRVATCRSPVWLNGTTNQVDGQSNTGRWVYCQMPGLPVLPAGDYYVTVYNGNGSPNGWGVKRLGYWENYGNPGASTYQTLPPGANGITNGPLYAPPTPLASTVTDYSTGLPEPGQSVFAVGPPNQVPTLYVGGSPSGIYSGPALFQNYWVDLEATPAGSLPEAPAPPRIPHPALLDGLLEIAAYRAEGATPPAQSSASGSDTGTGTEGIPSIGLASSDAGSGAEASTITATLSDTDAGSGADTSSVGISGADAGSGADAATVAATLSSADTGSGADAGTVGVTSSDTGTGADSASIAAALSDTDSGSGADSAAIGVSGADAGSGADSGSASAALSGTDIGSGTEAATIGTSGADTGSGADSGLVAVSVSGSDTGAGADAAAIGVAGAEAGTGADSGTVAATLASGDTGTGAETAAIGLASSDTGSGADSGSVVLGASGSDTGSGSDAGSVTASLSSSDAGSGADLAAVGISAADTGSGADAGSVSQGPVSGEGGSGSDSGTVTATVRDSDTGSGADSGSVPGAALPLRAGLLGGTVTSGNAYGGTASNAGTYAGSAA